MLQNTFNLNTWCCLHLYAWLPKPKVQVIAQIRSNQFIISRRTVRPCLPCRPDTQAATAPSRHRQGTSSSRGEQDRHHRIYRPGPAAGSSGAADGHTAVGRARAQLVVQSGGVGVAVGVVGAQDRVHHHHDHGGVAATASQLPWPWRRAGRIKRGPQGRRVSHRMSEGQRHKGCDERRPSSSSPGRG
jgi:hypothetical protein